MKHRLTRAADADIERTLRQTLKLFGVEQFKRYSSLIGQAVAFAANDPKNAQVMDRSEIRVGLKSLHLETVARRRNGGAHILYFLERNDAQGVPEIVIVRLLHERMEAKARIAKALREVHSIEHE